MMFNINERTHNRKATTKLICFLRRVSRLLFKVELIRSFSADHPAGFAFQFSATFPFLLLLKRMLVGRNGSCSYTFRIDKRVRRRMEKENFRPGHLVAIKWQYNSTYRSIIQSIIMT